MRAAEVSGVRRPRLPSNGRLSNGRAADHQGPGLRPGVVPEQVPGCDHTFRGFCCVAGLADVLVLL